MGRILKIFETNKLLRPILLFWLRHIEKPICKWPTERYIRGVMDCYERHMGYRFDIRYPVLFTEKLQWYKVFFQREDFESITDKYLFKSYILKHLGEGFTIPCYGAWTSIKELERAWKGLPEEFVLKANLQSDGRNIKVIHHKSEIRFKDIKHELKRWLKVRNTLLNSWDWRFYDGTPRILAEQFMANFEDQLYDYKFFCFDGEPHCMYVAQNHFGEKDYPISFYDLNWNLLDVHYGNHSVAEAAPPKHFIEMINISRALSKGFPFIRVDFFDTDDHLYVAELTFTPGGGCTPYYPVSFNRALGELMTLPS